MKDIIGSWSLMNKQIAKSFVIKVYVQMPYTIPV